MNLLRNREMNYVVMLILKWVVSLSNKYVVVIVFICCFFFGYSYCVHFDLTVLLESKLQI